MLKKSLLIAALSVASVAQAADGYYFGIQYGKVSMKNIYETQSGNYDTFGGSLGYQITDMFGVEVRGQIGSRADSFVEEDSGALVSVKLENNVALVGTLTAPIYGGFSLVSHAGVASSSYYARTASAGDDVSESGLTYGVAGVYNFTDKFAVTLEASVLPKIEEDGLENDVNAFGLGIKYSF
jgi:hypothetical protein